MMKVATVITNSDKHSPKNRYYSRD